MPSIESNLKSFDHNNWVNDGANWSEDWGYAEAQWWGCIWPRIFPFAHGDVLEIGYGRGRWTKFLMPVKESYVGVDISKSCKEYCENKWDWGQRGAFYYSDGKTLPMCLDHSIDFCFSFDSLVHCEWDVISSYLTELKRVLKPGGVAFLHHSNVSTLFETDSIYKNQYRNGVTREAEFRGSGLTVGRIPVRLQVIQLEMSCLIQETVPWGKSSEEIDCLTTLVNKPGIDCQVISNHLFMEEAATIKRISTYG